jgi:hypothetical protein
MRRFRLLLVICVFFTCFSPMTSCKVKEGCGLEEKMAPDMETSKRGKSNLFNEGRRKKMKSKH